MFQRGKSVPLLAYEKSVFQENLHQTQSPREVSMDQKTNCRVLVPASCSMQHQLTPW